MSVASLGVLGVSLGLLGLANPAMASPRAPSNTSEKTPPKKLKSVKLPGIGQVALTFDDGPDDPNTPRLIAFLKEYNLQATFFVVGRRVEQNRAMIVEMSEAGHSIQNHSFSHPYFSSLTSAEVANELKSNSDLIESLIGKRPTSFRPPYGSTSDRVRAIAKKQKMREVMWNGGSPSMTATQQETIASVRRSAWRAQQKEHGLTLLFHDGSGRFGATLKSLPTVITDLQSKGYEFVILK